MYEVVSDIHRNRNRTQSQTIFLRKYIAFKCHRFQTQFYLIPSKKKLIYLNRRNEIRDIVIQISCVVGEIRYFGCDVDTHDKTKI